MKKIEIYIDQLEKELVKLPNNEIQEILQDQQEYFYNGINSGRSEDSLLKEFGDPKAFAREILAESSLIEAEQSTRINDQFKFTWKAAWLTLLLTPLNVFVVWVPFLFSILCLLVYWILIGTSAITSIALVLAFLVGFLPVDVSVFNHLSGLFLFLGWCSLNISLLGLGGIITKFVFKQIQFYIKWNLRVIKQSGLKRGKNE